MRTKLQTHLADEKPDRIRGEKSFVQLFPLSWLRVPEVFHAIDIFRPFRGKDLLVDVIESA